MTIDERTYEMTTNQYDFGIPIIFEADVEKDFSIGDTIIFAFDCEEIANKTFTITQDKVADNKFTFEVSLTQEEADSLYSKPIIGYTTIHYSIKRYREDIYLESLENENGESLLKMKVKGTVRID